MEKFLADYMAIPFIGRLGLNVWVAINLAILGSLTMVIVRDIAK